MSDVALSVPLKFRRGSLRDNERASVDSALAILDLIDGIKPVAGARVLDFGCGVKLAQGLVERGDPQQMYVGLDVYQEMIEHLQSALTNNPKYEFATVNFQNNMYNPNGEIMTPESKLDISEGTFDILTMFSVITHMEPRDARAILHILRGLAASGARLIFSTFIDENQEEDFFDNDPNRPLLQARYRKGYLEGLIKEAGWTVESYNKPVKGVIQHHYVCAPA